MRARARARLLPLALLATCNEPVPKPAPAPPPLPEQPPTPTTAPPPKPDLPPPTLRVATYNILAAKRGLPGVIETLRTAGADVIALQEVDRNTRRFARIDQPAKLAEALSMNVHFARHRRYDGGEIGVALLSRFPIRDPEALKTSPDATASLRATLDTDRGQVDVVVVHYHPTDPRDPTSTQERMDRLRMAEARKAVLAGTRRSAPSIVLGDFNARQNSPEYALFDDHFTDACADHAFATWPAPLPVIRIDYVWTSRHFESRRCEPLVTTASDHLPVIVDLDFTGS